jgi:mannosyl-oligosaccharide alpha-1,2-mannosidase
MMGWTKCLMRLRIGISRVLSKPFLFPSISNTVTKSWDDRRGEPAPYTARYMLRSVLSIPPPSPFLMLIFFLSLYRPETIESLFIAYRLTGDERYRERGWDIFQAIEKHCRIDTGGYATIINVDEVPTQKEDKMETFFLASFFF